MALEPWSYAEKTNTEHAHQASLFMWANMAANFGYHIAQIADAYTVKGRARYLAERTANNEQFILPMLKWLHAIPNQGTASVQRGVNMRAEGLKSGVFDVFLPYPIFQPWNDILIAGLYIEMKRPKTATQAPGKLSDEQKAFKAYAESVGYKCVECWTWLEARDAILQYLGVNNV